MKEKKEKKIISSFNKIVILVSVIIAIASLVILLYVDLPNKPLSGKGKNFKDDAVIGGDFTLKDQNDTIFDSNELHGKMTLIYFGFTYCPDICPTSLQKLAKVLEMLDKYDIDINVVFVTIDPTRDTTGLLKEYLNYFDSRFIGLTGSEDEIEKVTKLFKVYSAKIPDTTNNNQDENSYMMDHSSFVYLMDKNFNYVQIFDFNTKALEIVNAIWRYDTQQTN